MTDDRKLLNNMKSVAILPLLTTLFTYAKRWNILCSTFVQCAAALNHRRHHHQTARCLHERCVLYGMRHGTTFGVQRFAFRLMKYGSLSIFSVFPIFWFCFAPWTSCLPSYPNPILVITIDVCTFLYIDVQQTHTHKYFVLLIISGSQLANVCIEMKHKSFATCSLRAKNPSKWLMPPVWFRYANSVHGFDMPEQERESGIRQSPVISNMCLYVLIANGRTSYRAAYTLILWSRSQHNETNVLPEKFEENSFCQICNNHKSQTFHFIFIHFYAIHIFLSLSSLSFIFTYVAKTCKYPNSEYAARSEFGRLLIFILNGTRNPFQCFSLRRRSPMELHATCISLFIFSICSRLFTFSSFHSQHIPIFNFDAVKTDKFNAAVPWKKCRKIWNEMLMLAS